MTTRSVEELRRQLLGRPEFQQKPSYGGIHRGTGQINPSLGFEDFAPDAVPSDYRPSLSNRQIAAPGYHNTPDYVQAARIAAGEAPVLRRDVWGRQRERVPDYVQAANRATAAYGEIPAPPFASRPVVSTLGPYDTGGLEDLAPGFRMGQERMDEAPPSGRRTQLYPTGRPSVPAGVDPHRYLGLRSDYYYPSGAERHGPDELVPNPANKEMFGQLTPQRVTRRGRQLLSDQTPQPSLSWRDFVPNVMQNPGILVDPLRRLENRVGRVLNPLPSFAVRGLENRAGRVLNPLGERLLNTVNIPNRAANALLSEFLPNIPNLRNQPEMAGGFNPNAYIKGWPGYGGMFPGEPSPMYPQSIGIRPNQAWGNTWWSGAPGYATEPMPDRYGVDLARGYDVNKYIANLRQSPMYPTSAQMAPNRLWGNTWWSGAPGYASEPMPDRYRANPGISLRNPDPYIYTGR